MGEISSPKPVKLIVSMIAASEDLFEVVGGALCEKYGEVDFETEIVPFNHTEYYEPQMGPGLRRKFVSFARLIDSGSLADVKLFTNELEARIIVGIPLPVPRFWSIKLIIDGTITAGDTAATMNPRIAACGYVILKR